RGGGAAGDRVEAKVAHLPNLLMLDHRAVRLAQCFPGVALRLSLCRERAASLETFESRGYRLQQKLELSALLQQLRRQLFTTVQQDHSRRPLRPGSLQRQTQRDRAVTVREQARRRRGRDRSEQRLKQTDSAACIGVQ